MHKKLFVVCCFLLPFSWKLLLNYIIAIKIKIYLNVCLLILPSVQRFYFFTSLEQIDDRAESNLDNFYRLADERKEEGNQLYKLKNYREALTKYSEAIGQFRMIRDHWSVQKLETIGQYSIK